MKSILLTVVAIACFGTAVVLLPILRYPPGTPISLRIAALEWLPGAETFIALNAHKTAATDFYEGSRVLLTDDQRGAYIRVEKCWVSSIESNSSRDASLIWLDGRTRPVIVLCNREIDRSATWMVLQGKVSASSFRGAIFTEIYNSTMLELMGARLAQNSS